jgi:hypothetical protein
MTRLITFATDNMSIAAQICKDSALANNVDEVKVYGPKDIDAEFMADNKAIFDQPRGFGYWLWKPYLIDRELKEMNEGDFLIYSDAGIEFVNNVNHVIDRMPDDIWLFGNMWQHEHWCKGDVLYKAEKIGVFNLGHDEKQVQASVIIIRNTAFARHFVSEWLKYCQVPGYIDDSPSKTPNPPEFKEHRHDQAILTCLAYSYGRPLHWWPAMYNAGNFTYDKTGYSDTYPVLFHHHRMRNEQFVSADELDKHMQKYFFNKYPDLSKTIIEKEWWTAPNVKVYS